MTPDGSASMGAANRRAGWSIDRGSFSLRARSSTSEGTTRSIVRCPFRNDCGTLTADAAPIDFLYPHAGTSLYIPLDLGAKKGRAVFEAVHREPGATLFWHLDDRYLGATETFHQQALDIAPGVHVVTVVDGAGNRLSRRFEVLGESR